MFRKYFVCWLYFMLLWVNLTGLTQIIQHWPSLTRVVMVNMYLDNFSWDHYTKYYVSSRPSYVFFQVKSMNSRWWKLNAQIVGNCYPSQMNSHHISKRHKRSLEFFQNFVNSIFPQERQDGAQRDENIITLIQVKTKIV